MDLFSSSLDKKKFEKISLDDGELLIMNNFLNLNQAQSYFGALINSINWKQEEIKLYGKVFPVPRMTAWYGYQDFNYSYSGIMCNPNPWTPELMEIKKSIEEFMPEEDFNSVLLNLYRNGNDSVSWHSDDEKELGQNPTIASLSLGATRRFDLKHRTTVGKSFKIDLSPGSLIVMNGEFQHFWRHQIPKQPKIDKPRINLTFRTIKA